MATALQLDTLNGFWKHLHDSSQWKQYHGPRRRIVQDAFARYRQVLSQARPFSIDERALKIAYKLSLEPAETVARRLMLARLPFPKTWIEFDFKQKLLLSEANGTSPGIEPGTPTRIGFLLEESPTDASIWGVTTVIQPDPDDIQVTSAGSHTGISVVTWMVDTLNRAPPYNVGNAYKQLPTELWDGMVRDDLGLDSDKHPSIRHLGWGYTAEGLAEREKVAPMRTLTVSDVLFNSINVGLSPVMQGLYDEVGVGEHNRFKQIVLDSAVEQRGDVRILVALLSLINEVPIIKEFTRPSGKVHLGGSIRPFLRNTIVKIDIPTKRYMGVVRSILKNAQNRAKARHEVRGHWRTIIHKHAHERKITHADGTIERIQIHKGELERVWVESHERGDASVGYVKHKYVVEKGQAGNLRPV